MVHYDLGEPTPSGGGTVTWDELPGITYSCTLNGQEITPCKDHMCM